MPKKTGGAPKGFPRHGLTSKEFSKWINPREALTRFEGLDIGATPIQIILPRLTGGLVRAAASQITTIKRANLGFDPARHNTENGPFEIPQGHWIGRTSDLFWNTGDVEFDLNDPRGFESEKVLCFGIRFEPSGVDEIVGTFPRKPFRGLMGSIVDGAKAARRPAAPVIAQHPQSTESNPSPERHKPQSRGGRPRKEWWDDLWVEMCRQIYLGDLQPKRQADIEKAMLTWLSNGGHDASEGTIRSAARKLFAMLNKEDKN